MSDPNNVKKTNHVSSTNHLHQLNPEQLRQYAEQTVRHTESLMLETLSPEETRQMLHELHVHQIELEMQNEELRRAHAELDAVRERYFDLYDMAPVGYCTISDKGMIKEANLTAANLLGVDRVALVRQPITRFILRDDQDIFYLHRKKLLETSKPQQCELRMLKNDAIIWTRMEAILAMDSEGVPICRVTISDITTRKKAEEALLRSESHFKLLAETSEELIVWKNVDVVISELCRKTMEHLGCDIFSIYLIDPKAGKLHLKASAGLPDERVKEIEWVDIGSGINGCVVLGNKPVIREDISKASDEQTRAARAIGVQAYACFPLLAQDVHIGTLGFATKTRAAFSKEDVTLVKTVAAHMATAMQRTIMVDRVQKAHDGLELLVQERTKDLIKMVDALRESNLQLEDFAHIASHDLQEPLRKIITFADRLIATGKSALSDQERDYLARMNQAAGRMRSLISELVKYSQVTSDHDALKRINLKKPVEEATKDLSMLLEESGGVVEIGTLPDVEGNETQLRQLFQNLISNALKYRSEQKPLIRIYSNSSTDANFQEIHVQDNGIGFDEMFLDKIFKPFQRLHGKTSQYQGTGMGLAICRKIVEHHGGSIMAKSETGKGSTFIVRLPRSAS
jgi:PAS domain S-box-containing protein